MTAIKEFTSLSGKLDLYQTYFSERHTGRHSNTKTVTHLTARKIVIKSIIPDTLKFTFCSFFQFFIGKSCMILLVARVLLVRYTLLVRYGSKRGMNPRSTHCEADALTTDGVVVRASASQSVDLGFIPLVKSYQKTLRNGIYSFPAWRWHLWEIVENKPASSLVVSLGKTLNGMPPPLCGRQVAHKPRKRQLPSECGLPVQSIAIQFAFS